MFEVKVNNSFSAAHRLRNYQGKCEELHGHNWKVEITARTERLDALGLALDFSLLKKILTEELDRLDHKYLNEIPPFDSMNPTSEVLAQYLFDAIGKKIDDDRVRLVRVDVWENENSRASYFKS